MRDQTSEYQAFKIWLAEILPVDRDILHVLIGVMLVLIAAFLWRICGGAKPFIWAFSISCVLAIGMEALDMKDDIRTFGFWRWRASLLDFVRTTSIPFLALLVAFQLKGKAQRSASFRGGSRK